MILVAGLQSAISSPGAVLWEFLLLFLLRYLLLFSPTSYQPLPCLGRMFQRPANQNACRQRAEKFRHNSASPTRPKMYPFSLGAWTYMWTSAEQQNRGTSGIAVYEKVSWTLRYWRLQKVITRKYISRSLLCVSALTLLVGRQEERPTCKI